MSEPSWMALGRAWIPPAGELRGLGAPVFRIPKADHDRLQGRTGAAHVRVRRPNSTAFRNELQASRPRSSWLKRWFEKPYMRLLAGASRNSALRAHAGPKMSSTVRPGASRRRRAGPCRVPGNRPPLILGADEGYGVPVFFVMQERTARPRSSLEQRVVAGGVVRAPSSSVNERSRKLLVADRHDAPMMILALDFLVGTYLAAAIPSPRTKIGPLYKSGGNADL